jgi:hypothetical protein
VRTAAMYFAPLFRDDDEPMGDLGTKSSSPRVSTCGDITISLQISYGLVKEALKFILLDNFFLQTLPSGQIYTERRTLTWTTVAFFK